MVYRKAPKSYTRKRYSYTSRAPARAQRMARVRGNLYRPPQQARPQSETGFVDTSAATYNLDLTGSLVLLNTVPQGPGTSARIGKKVHLRSLQCRGYMANLAASSVNDVSFLIVYDKRPTGTLPNITDILNTASSRSFNNDNNSGRFRIMKRHDAILVGATDDAPTLGPNTAESADFYLNLKGLPTVFKSAGTGAIGDIEEGALYLVTVGSNAAGATAAALYAGFRLRFDDF